MNKIGKGKIWISLIVIIILGLVILFVDKSKNKEVAKTPVLEEKKTTTTVKKTTTSAPTGAVSLSYAQALEKYSGSRIQINSSCQFAPASAVYKVGTNVMLDNRSDASKSVLFNGTRYTIPGYGFKVVTLSTAKTFQVDCGSYQNVATITVAN